MQIIGNSGTNTHRQIISNLCLNADELVIASPFCYSDFFEFARDLQRGGTVKKIVFVTTLKSDEVVRKIDSLLSFRDKMMEIGVQWEIHRDDNLHGKVYIFKSAGTPFACIITSANLTKNGMEDNHEWGVLVDARQEIIRLERQLLADTTHQFLTEEIESIKALVESHYPGGVPKQNVINVEIDDIIKSYPVKKDTRIFIKPIGSSEKPVYEGDYSKTREMHFSIRRPNSVREGDILIAYGVGSCKIVGAYIVTSKPIKTENVGDRWPWFVLCEALSPKLSGGIWVSKSLHVTGIANDYAKTGKIVTYKGGKNLNGLNFGCDKIRLSDEYGRYLLGKVMNANG